MHISDRRTNGRLQRFGIAIKRDKRPAIARPRRAIIATGGVKGFGQLWSHYSQLANTTVKW